jgi:hypothetical protein
MVEIENAFSSEVVESGSTGIESPGLGRHIVDDRDRAPEERAKTGTGNRPSRSANSDGFFRSDACHRHYAVQSAKGHAISVRETLKGIGERRNVVNVHFLNVADIVGMPIDAGEAQNAFAGCVDQKASRGLYVLVTEQFRLSPGWNNPHW